MLDVEIFASGIGITILPSDDEICVNVGLVKGGDDIDIFVMCMGLRLVRMIGWIVWNRQSLGWILLILLNHLQQN